MLPGSRVWRNGIKIDQDKETSVIKASADTEDKLRRMKTNHDKKVIK